MRNQETKNMKRIPRKLIKISKNMDIEIEKESKEIKGYDSRNIKRPTEWTGEKDEFTVWRVLFVAYLGTFDKIWKNS